jgi:hypothetical protein
MTIRSYALRAVLVSVLVGGALALWLSAAAPGHAETSNQVQGTVVSVQGKAISWDDNAQCGALHAAQGWPSPALTAGFGSSPPGGGSLHSIPFLGCVTSNATWHVDAVASALTPADASSSIPGANVHLYAEGLTESRFSGFGDPSPAPIAPECDVYTSPGCSLGTTRPIVVGAQPTPASSGFFYSYRLDGPGSAPSGTYTGSVTFTASN